MLSYCAEIDDAKFSMKDTKKLHQNRQFQRPLYAVTLLTQHPSRYGPLISLLFRVEFWQTVGLQ